MFKQIPEVLISKERIAARVAELGAQISEDYKGKDLLMVGALKGSVVFMSDLMRAVSVPMSIDFITASSYGSGVNTSGVVKIVQDITQDIAGRDVLIVEDILDTGTTLNRLTGILLERRPKSLKLAALLEKPSRKKMNIQADYVGFTIPNVFVVGYGLDFNELYRNLPYVGILNGEE